MKRTGFLALLGSLNIAGAQETIVFTANMAPSEALQQLAVPGYSLCGHGRFTLSGSNLGYQVAVPLGNWNGEIRGPAGAATSAPVLFDLGTPGCAAPYPPYSLGGCAFSGNLVLSDGQISELKEGLWYANAVLGGSPDAYLRGQITQGPLDGDCDGVPDDQDQCPQTPFGIIVNDQGCTIEQLCPCQGAWENHQGYVKCVKGKALAFFKEGRIAQAERHAIVKQAERSDCGNPRERAVGR